MAPTRPAGSGVARLRALAAAALVAVLLPGAAGCVLRNDDGLICTLVGCSTTATLHATVVLPRPQAASCGVRACRNDACYTGSLSVLTSGDGGGPLSDGQRVSITVAPEADRDPHVDVSARLTSVGSEEHVVSVEWSLYWGTTSDRYSVAFTGAACSQLAPIEGAVPGDLLEYPNGEECDRDPCYDYVVGAAPPGYDDPDADAGSHEDTSTGRAWSDDVLPGGPLSCLFCWPGDGDGGAACLTSCESEIAPPADDCWCVTVDVNLTNDPPAADLCVPPAALADACVADEDCIVRGGLVDNWRGECGETPRWALLGTCAGGRCAYPCGNDSGDRVCPEGSACNGTVCVR